MESLITGLIVGIIALIVGFAAGIQYRKKVSEKEISSAEEEAKRIINEAIKGAESKKREALVEAKEEILRARTEHDREVKERRADLQKQERRLQQKEENLDRKTDAIERKEDALSTKLADLEAALLCYPEVAHSRRLAPFELGVPVGVFVEAQPLFDGKHACVPVGAYLCHILTSPAPGAGKPDAAVNLFNGRKGAGQRTFHGGLAFLVPLAEIRRQPRVFVQQQMCGQSIGQHTSANAVVQRNGGVKVRDHRAYRTHPSPLGGCEGIGTGEALALQDVQESKGTGLIRRGVHGVRSPRPLVLLVHQVHGQLKYLLRCGTHVHSLLLSCRRQKLIEGHHRNDAGGLVLTACLLG
ncbi:MAG: DUF3552 domain-containing protein [Clostridia bacterium]|nr:DUF3552 domain-containing protein [Clostridia bacterium]